MRCAGLGALHVVALLPSAWTRHGRGISLAHLAAGKIAGLCLQRTQPLATGAHHRSTSHDQAGEADQATGADQDCTDDHRRAVYTEPGVWSTLTVFHGILSGVVGRS